MRIGRLVASALLVCASSLFAQVTYERILNAEHEARNWLTYSGGYKSWRYSVLDQINTANAGKLSAQWVFQSASLGQFETTPLVIDGVLYGTGQDNRAFALDARTGRPVWRYQRNLPEKIQACCGMVNRGFAALGDKLLAGTINIDAPLVARIDAVGDATVIAEIARMMEAAGQGKSRYVRIADRAARWYAPAVHTLAALSGRRAPRVRIPHALAIAAAAVDEVVEGRLLGREPLAPLDGALMARKRMWVDGSRAVRELGLPQSSVRDALADAIAFHRGRAAA